MSQPTSMNSTWLATPSTPAFSNRVMLRMQSGTYRPNNSHLTKPARNLLKLHVSDIEGLFRQSNTKKALRGCSVISKGTVMASALGFCDDDDMVLLGGLRDVPANDEEVESLARFAVDEHNKKQNAVLEFARVVKAKEQVVAGMLYHLTLEIVVEAGKKKLYEAKVCVQPWLNFKELVEFKPASDGSGWREVPGDDPEVQQVADHAVKTIQQRSNSLFPYELQEVVHANAEVTGEAAKFHMLLRLKRGDKEEKFKVEVHKKREGVLHLNHMEQLHD